MGLSLRNLTHKVWDQVNPLDNGRTFKNPQGSSGGYHMVGDVQYTNSGAPQRSVWGQLTHNGATNTAGNFIAKPVVATAVEPFRALAASTTGNRQAYDAAAGRFMHNSIPGQLTNQVYNAGKATADLAFKAPVQDIMGNHIGAENTRGSGLRAFNETVAGALTTPLQEGVANMAHANRSARLKGGLNPDATGAQKYIGNPVVGAVGLYGIGKGMSSLADRVVTPKTAAVEAPKTITKIPVQGTSEATPIPVRTVTKIPVRNVPSQEELVNRYNDHMAQLNRTWSAAQNYVTLKGKQGRQAIMSEPSIYNDVGYQAEKQRIQQQFEDGTLPKRISVTQDTPTVTGKRGRPTGPAVQLQEMPTPEEAAATAKQQAETQQKQALAKIESNTNPTKSQQIQEALLREKLGMPDFQKTEAAVAAGDKSPGLMSRLWQSANGYISGHGEAGMETARRIGKARDNSELMQQGVLDKIPTVMGLHKGDIPLFVKTLNRLSKGERDLVDIPEHIQAAVAEWKQVMPEIRQRAIDAGLDVGDLGEHYFPRQYKNLNKGNFAQSLVDSGKAKTLKDANAIVKKLRDEQNRPYGNLERTRESDVPGYEMTHDAIVNYISRSADRISHAEQFGGKGEILDQLKQQMEADGHDTTAGKPLDRALNVAMENVDKNTPGHKASSVTRKVNAVRMLGGAGISNATQLTNTATVAGIGRTAKGVWKLATSKQARQEARETAVNLDSSIEKLAKGQVGTTGKITSNIASPFFRAVEKFNRQATAIVGKDYGNHLAAKVAKGHAGSEETLRQLGVEGDIGAKLTRDQEIQASRGLVKVSQFKVDPMDMPGWTDSAMGKLAAQMRSFQYKQTDFMYNQVLRQAFHGNFVPLTRFIAVGVPAGTVSLAARGLLKGNNPFQFQDGQTNEQKGLSVAGDAISQVGGLGLPGSEALNLKDSVKYDNVTGGVASTVGGPTLGAVAETLQNVDKGIGGNWKPLGKEAIRQVPTIGPKVSKMVFPKKETPSTGGTKKTADLSIEEMDNRAKQETTDFKKGMKPDGQGLQKLSNGKYIYQTGNDSHTADKLKDAQDAIAKYNFDKSDAQDKVLRGTYYYKDGQGKTQTMPEQQHQYNLTDSKNQLDMDTAYEGGDWEGWQKLAQSQWQVLEDKKQFYNPATQQDKLDDLTLKQQNLETKFTKYSKKVAQGKGFGDTSLNGTGGSGGGSGGSKAKNSGSAHKYDVSLTAGRSEAAPKITMRQPSSGANSGGGGGRSGYRASRPKVSLKKSKV